jgi:hypothetical protein
MSALRARSCSQVLVFGSGDIADAAFRIFGGPLRN